ncbi:MAG: hypothetical protein PHP35_02475 [Candidatus Colwellbacteria bacterium]|nr:hypothetical protein [Candidatus Colwellbacteria bacterium]
MAPTKKGIGIINGPGKFDLMNALFIGSEVTFTLDSKEVIIVRIDLIQAEDGSHESWNFEGFVKSSRWIKGYYSTKNRTGHAQFFSHKEWTELGNF